MGTSQVSGSFVKSYIEQRVRTDVIGIVNGEHDSSFCSIGELPCRIDGSELIGYVEIG